MTGASLREFLHPDQDYIAQACAALNVTATGQVHPVATSTCLEKAALLRWSPRRIVKALYFSDGSRWIGIVLPELSLRLDVRGVLGDLLGMPAAESQRFRLNGCPPGMEPGTCTPFPLRRTMSGPGPRIERILVHQDAELGPELVDVSIGGTGERAHLLSCHLPYAAIYDVLAFAFGEQVRRDDLRPYLKPAARAGRESTTAAIV